MQLPRHLVSGLGMVLVAGPVLGAASTAGSSLGMPTESHAQRSATSCAAEGGTGAVRAPRFVRQIATGETGWFSSPGLVDLDARRPARDRRAVLLDVRVRRDGSAAGAGAGERGPGLSPVGGHRPRGRRRRRHRGRRRLGHGGGVRVPGRRAAPQGGVAGVHEQRRPVAGGPRARRRGPGRRRPGRGGGDDDQHLTHRRPGLRLRRRAATCSSRRAATPPPGPATTGSPGRATTCGSTRSATTATARTARTSRSGTSTTTPTWRSSPPSTTTRSTPSTSTARRSSRRPGSPTGSRTRPAGGWAGDSSSGGPIPASSGATTTGTPGRGRARPARPGCSGPRRRPRWPTWTATAATR